MTIENKMLKDKFCMEDLMFNDMDRQAFKQKTLFTKTKISAVDEFGRVLFENLENQTVLGGVTYVLEKLWNTRTTLNIATLNDILSIGTGGPPIIGNHSAEDCVCLWGIGIGGSGDAIASVRDVKHYEREIGTNGNSTEMVPFRVVDGELTGIEKDKYWFAKEITPGKTAYYLKKFEIDPIIKHLWKDSEDENEDGTEITPDVYNTTRTELIETFVEMKLQITKKDVREYFEYIDEIEKTRINTIGLCSGILVEIEPDVYEYKNVRLFSKLNFNNEMLDLIKEINFTYRIYTS